MVSAGGLDAEQKVEQWSVGDGAGAQHGYADFNDRPDRRAYVCPGPVDQIHALEDHEAVDRYGGYAIVC